MVHLHTCRQNIHTAKILKNYFFKNLETNKFSVQASFFIVIKNKRGFLGLVDCFYLFFI